MENQDMSIRDRVTNMFEDVGEHYREDNLASYEIHQGHDVHAFYHLIQKPSEVVHVQGYPGMSNNCEARVWARLMNYDNMIQIRRNRGVSIGNEHEATVKAFPNFEGGIFIPYCSTILESKLEENIPELRVNPNLPNFMNIFLNKIWRKLRAKPTSIPVNVLMVPGDEHNLYYISGNSDPFFTESAARKHAKRHDQVYNIKVRRLI